MVLSRHFKLTSDHAIKSKYSFWGDLIKGDTVQISVEFGDTGNSAWGGRKRNPKPKIKNVRTGEVFSSSFVSFSSYVNKLDLSEL